ncbi:MAG: type II secretion system protein GspE, partial [Candidatus Omnitrophica bacterium]|nr:type II secretion system protein GspE [Candidatus Omnitrophota bacterium]
APGAVIRMANLGIENFLIASSLVCAVAQRLVRRLCPECREEAPLPEYVADQLGLSRQEAHKHTIYRPQGCDLCYNTGYAGRLVICEVMPVTPEVRDVILRPDTQEGEIRAVAQKHGLRSLRQSGLEKLLAGETSVEEVLRVTTANDTAESAIDE